MKLVIASVIAIFVCQFSFGQVKVYNGSGEPIILYPDGTWKYEPKDTVRNPVVALDSAQAKDTITTNPHEFEKDNSATHLVKSKKLKTGVYIDNNIWGISKCTINEWGEYKFIDKEDNCMGVLVTETTNGLTMPDMSEFMLSNALGVSPDAEIISREYRIVNGLRVLCVELKYSIKKLRFHGVSYIYANEEGGVQLSAFTTEKKFNKNYDVLVTLLNGLNHL